MFDFIRTNQLFNLLFNIFLKFYCEGHYHRKIDVKLYKKNL